MPPPTATVDTSGFNAAEQLTSITDVKGSNTVFSASYGRDPVGQVSSDSSVPSNVGADKYTALNQLCYAASSNTASCTAPPSGSQAYGFDAADNLVGDNGITQAFNAADELCWSVSGSSSSVCTSPPTGATQYGYNPRGDRTAVTPSGGAATTLGYDQANRLTSWVKGTTSATYSYDGDGLRMSKTVSAVTTRFTWDVSASIPLLLSDGTSDYAYGPGGLPLEQITVRPPISRVGTATASGKATSLRLTLPSGVKANDQVFLASTQPSTTTVTTPTGYSIVASVTSGGSSPLAKTVVYRHTVVAGDTSVSLTYSTSSTAQSAVLAVYRGVDPSLPVEVSATASSAAATSVAAPSVSAAYAGDELVVFQGAAGTFSGTSWAAPSGMSEQAQVNTTANTSTGVADQTLSNAGTTGTRKSTYGKSANLTTVILAAPAPPTVLFYHPDQLGNIRLLTDIAGAVRGSFTFDAYGNLTASSGAYTTPLGFAGQYQDSESGFTYLRARYYDPATGQLLTRDPAVAATRSPYAYVRDNPLNLVDPSGLVFTSDGTSLIPGAQAAGYARVYNDLATIAEQEAQLGSNSGLPESKRSDLLASIEGLMDNVYSEQTALGNPCSPAAKQLQSSIAEAGTIEENLAWRDWEQNRAGSNSNAAEGGALIGAGTLTAGTGGLLGFEGATEFASAATLWDAALGGLGIVTGAGIFVFGAVLVGYGVSILIN